MGSNLLGTPSDRDSQELSPPLCCVRLLIATSRTGFVDDVVWVKGLHIAFQARFPAMNKAPHRMCS
jgi:hypothetical protein